MVKSFLVDSCFWFDRSVFITGHTGFKGSWLTQWLVDLGAKVTGYALEPDTDPSLFKLAQLEQVCSHHVGDVRDYDSLCGAMKEANPEVVIHMAAQPLVRRSYQKPLETFSINVMGTAHTLEAARVLPSVKAILIISSDKCYENREWTYGYRETDPLGGHDPYSASKACTEIVSNVWRNAYHGGPLVASARAGNVFGGGDWSEDRLVPDAMRAFSEGQTLEIRSPKSERPWQHVCEPLAAYLMILRALLEGGKAYARAWNIGPRMEQILPVEQVVSIMAETWGKDASWKVATDKKALHEAGLLHLDVSQVMRHIGWRPSGLLREGLEATVAWRSVSQAAHAIARMRNERELFAGKNIMKYVSQ